MMNEEKRYIPYVSISLAAVNVVVFLLCIIMGPLLFDYGELSAVAVFEQRQVWRVFTSMFLHAGLQHLVSNMMLLVLLGGMLEETIGHVSLAITYFVSGVFAGIASLSYKVIFLETIPSVGASGALFGLDGLLLAMVVLLPGYRQKVSLPRALMMIGLSLYSGYSNQLIDNAAHVGGLIAGLCVGSLICLVKRRKGNYPIEY